jgi:hypothetical protein
MIARLLLIAIAEPAFVVALVPGMLKSHIGPRVTCGILSAISLVSLLFGVPQLAVQGIATIVAFLIFLLLRARSRFIAAGLFVPLFALYALCALGLTAVSLIDLSFAHGLVKRISTLRETYPLQSVAERLAYERKVSVNGNETKAGSNDPVLNSAVAHRLASAEQRLVEADGQHYFRRRRILAALHTQTNDEFVEASGFGRRRIADPGAISYAARLELPDLGPIPVEAEADPSYDPEYEAAIPTDELASQHQPSRNDLVSMHDSGIDDFVDAERIGFVKDQNHVAGFQSHRFTKMPEVSPIKTQSQRQWKIARLELVSLLKHDIPVVYVSKNLPQMDELQDAPTRPLDLFEQHALSRLRTDEDVMIEDTEDRIRMVGSLRAGQACLACHSVRRGDLLGALTYELVPAMSARKRASQVTPPSS